MSFLNVILTVELLVRVNYIENRISQWLCQLHINGQNAKVLTILSVKKSAVLNNIPALSNSLNKT